MKTTVSFAILMLSIVPFVSCATRGTLKINDSAACEFGDSRMVRDVIYFGRNKPGGGVVSDAEWQVFLDTVVTPRFPDGLTVTEARGQWRGASGAVEQEQAEIITLFHSGDEQALRAVSELSAEYKTRFHQEAVLRERTQTCALFQ